MDCDSRVTIDYLRALPEDSVVRWASDHICSEQPWDSGWVDVRIPGDGPPDMGWVWTILDPEDPEQGEPEQLWQFPWPFDLEVHSVFDPEQGWYGHELPVPAGTSLPSGLIEAYQRLALRVDRAATDGEAIAPVPAAIYEELLQRTGSAYRVRGGWSVRTISDALSDWTARHAGRQDLRFAWDPNAEDSPVLAEVKERAVACGPSWDLGDGLEVVDGVMDDLLALDPDEAATMTTILREAVSRFADTAA